MLMVHIVVRCRIMPLKYFVPGKRFREELETTVSHHIQYGRVGNKNSDHRNVVRDSKCNHRDNAHLQKSFHRVKSLCRERRGVGTQMVSKVHILKYLFPMH